MNKIDVFLNSISQKHFQTEFLGPSGVAAGRNKQVNNVRINAALRAAFEGGVRYAATMSDNKFVGLIKEVDIDLTMVALAGENDQQIEGSDDDEKNAHCGKSSFAG